MESFKIGFPVAKSAFFHFLKKILKIEFGWKTSSSQKNLWRVYTEAYKKKIQLSTPSVWTELVSKNETD